MIRKIFFWLVLLFSLVVLYFNTMMYLNYMVSLKYEVEHPMGMFGKSDDIISREREINGLLDFNKLIYGFTIVVIAGNFVLFRKKD